MTASSDAQRDGLPDDLVCSSRGCTRPATFQLLWNNPKIHTPDRRKIWLGCDEHEPTLRQFLSARGFWRTSEPLAPDASA